MDLSEVNKKTLIQIAMDDNMNLDFRYEAARELQFRWDNKLLPELVRLYGQGMKVREIADYLGTSKQEVNSKIQLYGLRRVQQ